VLVDSTHRRTPGKTCHRDTAPYQTAHRRFQNWVKSGVMEQLLLTLAQHLQGRWRIGFEECFVDGTFVPAKKGGDKWENQAGQGDQDHGALQTAMVFLSPCGQKVLAGCSDAGQGHLGRTHCAEVPQRLIVTSVPTATS